MEKRRRGAEKDAANGKRLRPADVAVLLQYLYDKEGNIYDGICDTLS